MSFLEEYCLKVENGEITACKRIKQVCRMLLDDIKKGIDEDGYYFDEEIANRPIDFIQGFLKLPSGKSNAPFVLDLFQKAVIQATFGFVHKDTKFRRFNKVMIIKGRKNGKTSLLAAIEIYLLVADGEFSPQIVNCATVKDQANLGFNAVLKMISQSSMLSKHVKKRTSDLYFKHNYGTIKSMASNTNSLDGLDIHGAILDELAAHKTRELFDLIVQAISARNQPLIFSISTNGFIRDSIFDSEYEYGCGILDGKIIDKKMLCFFYELDNRTEWDNPECWIKANPGLGTIKKMDYMEETINKAKNDPTFKPTVMIKEFNMPETSATAWLRWSELENKDKFDIDTMGFRYFIGGFDGGEVDDLSCATAIMMKPNDDTIYVEQMYWLPLETYEKRVKEGKIPYEIWREKGFLRVVDGNRVNFEVALEWFKELRYDKDIYCTKVGYDPWHVSQDLEQKFKDEFGKKDFVVVRQGVKTLSTPMKKLKTEFESKNINYNNNPILKWCLSNTEIKIDVNGGIQPIKGVDRYKKIDGLVSLLIAYVVLQDNLEDYKTYL